MIIHHVHTCIGIGWNPHIRLVELVWELDNVKQIAPDTFCITHAIMPSCDVHYISIVGVIKDNNWSIVITEEAAPVTRTILRTTGSERPLGSERHLYAIALSDKLKTDPMAVDGINKWTMTPPRKAGEIDDW